MQPTDDRFDDESRKFFQEVKKGKPRKFLMIKDGVQINKLMIFKLGTFDRVLRKAKQDGTRGEAYWGVLRGDGADIRFELSRSDGFVSPPGTDIRLKDFLREAAGLKLEPSYLIVDNLATIEDADDDDAVEATGDVESIVDTQHISNEGAAAKFSRLLHALLPHVNRVLALETPVSNELQASIRDAQELGRRSDFEQGLVVLRRVGELIKLSLAAMDSATSSAESISGGSSRRGIDETRCREWEMRLAEIEPRYHQAIRVAGPNVEQLQKVMDYAETQARNQQFVKALVGLDRVERMLSDLP